MESAIASSPPAHAASTTRSDEGRISPAALFAVAIIFILSGATALVYEVVWTRQLTTFFGSTLYGVATVLSAFMGGLALGSWLIGRFVDKMQYPLVVYGIFEIVTGLSALVFPFALQLSQPLIGQFYTTGGSGTFLTFSLIRFVVVFVLLLVPTTLMGATLPMMSKAVTRRLEQVGTRVGGLYALNTAGAVLGVFAAGFFMLEHLGVFRTTAVAVSLDIAIGIVSIWLGRTVFRVSDAQVASSASQVNLEAPMVREHLSPVVLRLVLFTYAASGFIALAYQVCWTRALIFSFDTLKSTTYSFSGMLIVFLLGLAVGSALMQGIVDKQRNLLRLYALLQTGIGLGGALSFFVIIRDLPTLNEIADDGSLIYWSAVFNVMYKTAAAIGLPTFLMGMAFPVVTKLVVGSLSHIGGDVAKVYALNTLGAILGSFAAGFVLIPLFGITTTIAMLASINLALAALLFANNALLSPKHRQLMTAVAVVAAIVVPVRIGTSDARLQRIQANETIVHYEEGAMATISVVENNSGDRMIYVDDVGVAGTDKVMLTDQKSLAHVPMVLLGGNAERALSVGFGSGGASFSYTLYDSLQEIHTIEIAPEVLRAAPVLTDSNHGIIVPDNVLAAAKAAGAERITGFRNPNSAYIHTPVPGFKTFDPRFKVLIDDARAYLRFTDVKYDIIATDCTDLRYKTNANLYDLEYFTLCRERITDDGLVVVWMPLAGLSDRAFRSALRTFQVVFPEMGVWYFTNQPTHYCLLIAGKGPLNLDYEAIRRAAALPMVSEDLEEIGLRDPDKLISSFVCDERTLTDLLASYPLNTEDHPIIEFESPRFGYDSRPLRDNQMRLYEVQTPAAALFENLPQEAGDRIWQLQQANFVVFRGHSEYRLYNFAGAARLYMEALAMVPWDTSIERLLDFEELVRHYETSKSRPTENTLAIGLGIAEVMMIQGRLKEAVTYAGETARMLPTILDPRRGEPREDVIAMAFGVHSVLARSYAQSGIADRAREYAAAARPFAENDQQMSELDAAIEAELQRTRPN